MTYSLSWAGRCMPQLVVLTQPVGGSRPLLWLAPQRRVASTSVTPAAQASHGGTVSVGRAGALNSSDWGEQEFGSLQKKATSRLHRFYVPQPLGPTPKNPSLEAFLGAAKNPAPGPPGTAAAAASGSARRRSARGNDPQAAGSAATAASMATDAAAVASPVAAGIPASGSTTVPAATVILEGEEARHAARALRLQPGDRVELCDGLGNLAEGVVAGADKQRVWVNTEGPAVHVPWRGSRWVVVVACTTLKGGRAEWLVEKLTELGAYMMVPLVTERSQAEGRAKFRTRGSPSSRGGATTSDPDGDSDGDYPPGRLERVAIAATKQSLRPHALHLAPPTALLDVLPLVQRAAGVGPEAGPRTGDCDGGSSVVTDDGASKRPAAEQHQQGAGSGSDGGGVSDSSSYSGLADGGYAAGGGGSGGGGGFCLVAVAGAPPLAEVLREVRGPGAAPGASGGPAADSGGSVGAGGGQVQAGDNLAESPLRVLFIGPEGDFTPAELAALVQAGARPVGLGANRLRTETAAIGLLAASLLTDDA